MQYIIGQKRFHLSYAELKEDFERFDDLSDKDFFETYIWEVLHFVCVVSYLKELANIQTLSDVGLLHQLIHTQLMRDEPLINKEEIRQQFHDLMELR